MIRSGALVWLPPNISVDSIMIMMMPGATGSQVHIQKRTPRRLFKAGLETRLLDMLVWRLARDDDIMHVAFAKPRAGDAYELRLFLQLLNGFTADVAHAAAQASDELIDHRFERSAVGHTAFDALGYELGKAVAAVALALHHAF